MQTRPIWALPKEISDRIAAGEVVERPLSIVKELIENSVDAGADVISVEIKKGGKEYIRVTDNGCGIPADEVRLAFERHATSKIGNADDLDAIETLGFRGEALASIAAVSRTEMLTKTAEARAGTRLVAAGGEVEEISDYACETGTTIVVRELFFNTPARRKFLKSDSSEAALISDCISKMALAYPGIRFRFINNENILFATPGKGDLRAAIATVYEPSAAKKLIDIDFAGDDADIRLHGLVSAPSDSRTNRRRQIFFVNGRWVRSRVFEQALDEAYRDKLFEGRHPAAFLFLEIDPGKVDVNIHPNKTELRFYDEETVKAFIAEAVRQGIKVPEAAPSAKDMFKRTSADKTADSFVATAEPREASDYPLSDSDAAPAFSAAEKAILYSDYFSTLRQEQQSITRPYSEAEDAEERTPRDFLFSALEIIGQVFAAYIIAKDEENLYLVDQHAAHERILYEKLIADYNKGDAASQMLMVPVLMSLGPSLKLQAEERLELLGALGFAIEEFGPSELVIKEVPASMSLEEAESFAAAVIETKALDRYNAQQKRDFLISRACKSAVKGNESLGKEEISSLFKGLDACENPYSCPHGRPTFVRLSLYDTERLFKRK